MDVMLFGMQGSGKGTQGKIVAERLGMRVFETGAELRAIVASDTPLGERIKQIIEAGNLVDTETVIAVVRNFLEHADPTMPILFDGIPRSLDQFLHFEPLMAEFSRSPKAVLLKISRDEAMTRLTARKTCASCRAVFGPEVEGGVCPACGGNLTVRSDDVPEAIRKRLDLFESETQPVIEAYRSQNRLVEIDGMRRVSEVTDAVFSVVSIAA